MSNYNMAKFIESLPLTEEVAKFRPPYERTTTSEGTEGQLPDIDNLPDGVVAASTIVAFSPTLSPTLRSSVVLSLIAAEKVADSDSLVVTPDLWVQRYNMVFKGLNWISLQRGDLKQIQVSTNVAVHNAIVPFLTLALGPGAAATSLILSAVNQMKTMDEATPWITLFDRESRKFDVSEYRFATVDDQGGTVLLRMAAARFIAMQDRVQVLFFKFNDTNISLSVSSATLAASADLLQEINGDLKNKLAGRTAAFLSDLNY